MYVCQSFVSDKEMILRAVVRDGTAGRLEDQHISRKKINLSSSTFFCQTYLLKMERLENYFTNLTFILDICETERGKWGLMHLVNIDAFTPLILCVSVSDKSCL